MAIKATEEDMTRSGKLAATGIAALCVTIAAADVEAKDKVKVGFIGPLTGGVSANGIGGRNSTDLAVRLAAATPPIWL